MAVVLSNLNRLKFFHF